MSRKFIAPLLSLLLATAVQAADPAGKAKTEGKPDSPSIGQVVYQVLVGEMALQRGQPELAAAAYADLAQRSRDPQVLQRTIDIAVFTRQPELALAAARLWVEVEPKSGRAREVLASVMASSNRMEDAEPQIARALAEHPERLADNLLSLNSLFVRQTDKQAALRMIERLVAPYRQQPEAHYALAQAAQVASDAVLSRAAIQEARRLRPDWEAAVIFEARLLVGSEKLAEASKLLGDFAATYPEAWQARSLYARSLVSERRFAEAQKEFAKLRAHSPDDPEILYPYAIVSLQQSDLDTGETLLKHLLETSFIDKPLAYYFLGQVAETRKDSATALERYQEVTFGDYYAAARIRMATLLTLEGKHDEARRTLQQSTPHTQEDRTQLVQAEARLLRERQQLEESYNVLKRGLKAQPEQPDLLYDIALVAERLQRTSEAETYLRRLVKLQPENPHALNALGYSLADRNLQLPEAYELISKASKLAPDNPFIMDSLGWVLFRQGKLKESASVLEKAYKLNNDPEIAAHLGEVWWQLGRKDDATRLWRTAAQAAPEHDVLGAVIKKYLP